MQISIEEIKTETGLHESLSVVVQAFATVSEQFGLTRDNCPSNSSFMTLKDMESLSGRSKVMFGLYEENRQVGFVALEQPKGNVWYIEKLAILPQCRGKGYGRMLMDRAFAYTGEQGGTSVSIGIIAENASLKKWYEDYGFIATGTKQFDHLPFTVCFMVKNI